MATQLLDETLNAAATRFAAKLAVEPGIAGISIQVTPDGAGLTTLPHTANRPRLRLFTSNFDLGAVTPAIIEGQLFGLALGVVEVPLRTGDDVLYSHAETLVTGEYLYAILETPVDLGGDVDVEVTVALL